MTKARDISKLLSTANGKIAGENLDVSFENITDTGTEGTKVASGTTAERGSTAGQWRYNTTTGFFEGRNASGTFSTLEPTPTIISTDVTEIDTATGGNITIRVTGTNFSSGSTIKFVANDSSEITASTSTFINTSNYDAVIARSSFQNSKEPYDVKYISQSGLSAVLEDNINVDNAPNWSTSAGTVATISDQDTGTHATLSASDADGDTVSYSETGGTNITGAGLSLDSSTGVISGNPTDVSNSTTVSFTGRATAGSKTTDRAFNIIIDPYRDIYFAILGAGGGGAGRQSSSYQGSSDWHGAGGAGSFVEAVYAMKLGTTIYTYVGHYGQSGQSGAAGGSINAYGGNGKGTGGDDTSGEGGDFSGIFTTNSVTQANALIIAGGGGGGSGRPHGSGGGGSQNGGGQIESASTGEGNDGTRGNHNPTHSHGSDRGGQGGQQNGGGVAGTGDATSQNNGQAGSALQGGNGSSAASWGNGGGGGGGFFGGGGGQDDGTSWGGAGGGAGSSFVRGGLTNYSTSAFNSVTATGITYQSHTFRTASFGYDGGTTQDSQNANRMKTTYNFSSFGSGYGTNGLGGRETNSYPGAGTDGGHGLVFYRVGSSGSYTRLTSVNTSGNLTSLTIS
jgi:hypothetical protein